jgi:hypothetical protein
MHIDSSGERFVRTTADLVRLVASATPKSTIVLRGAGSRPTPDLVQISAAARGPVIFVME